MREPRVETRGYFLASLTGLAGDTPMISALKPGLFPIALSGLQEGTYREPSPAIPGRPVGAARTGTRGRGCILAPSCVPRWRGWPPKAAGGGFEPRDSGRGMPIRSTPLEVGPLGLIRTGTRCRAGAALGTCPRSGPIGYPSHAACELSPEGTKENSSGFQPGDSRRSQIESRRDDRVRIRSPFLSGVPRTAISEPSVANLFLQKIAGIGA